MPLNINDLMQHIADEQAKASLSMSNAEEERLEHQQLFLGAVCKYFHETGTWPTYGLIDKVLRPYKGLLVEDMGKQLDYVMHDSMHTPLSGYDPNQTITMNVSAFARCQKEGIYPEMSEDLDAFMEAFRFCLERFEAGQEDLPITSSDITARCGMSELMLAKVFQLVLVEGFYEAHFPNPKPSDWSFMISRSVRKYRAVTTLDQYVTVRSELIEQSYSQTPFVLPTGMYGSGRPAIRRAQVTDSGSLIPVQYTQEVSAANVVVPMELVEGTRPYIEKIARQVNMTYAAQCYDACAVMLRRLIETLILEVFETRGIADLITLPNGDNMQFGALIDKTCAEKSLRLGRNQKRELPRLKLIGDKSAHDRRYNAIQNDIESFKDDIRGVVQALVYLANWK